MLFSGAIFLVFFVPLFFSVYYAIPARFRNGLALLASGLFFAWGAPKFLFVVILNSFLDFFLAQKIKTSRHSKQFLAAGLLLNLGLLFFYKYFNFFQEGVSELFQLLGFTFSAFWKIALPLGISFITFQKISFLVDVKRGDAEIPTSFFDYLLFVLLFPQLIAGPIIRFKELATQITERHNSFSWDSRLNGAFRFVLGLSKKVLIADQLALIADPVFQNPIEGSGHFIALIAFTFQIYFDFSGYSDMAIGLGRMMDFKFPENFNFPYKAQSIRSFWRKWHITLGQWMKDYLYIPLGGNRVSKLRQGVNLWIVFILSGLWHGAGINFIVWGAWHGLFMFLEHRVKVPFQVARSFRVLFTFLIVIYGWIWFNTDKPIDALIFQKELLNLSGFDSLNTHQWTVLTIAILFSFLPSQLDRRVRAVFQTNSPKSRVALAVLASLLFFMCLGAISTSSGQPFIYFRF